MSGASGRIVTFFSWASALILLACVSTVVGYLVIKGAGALSLDLVFGETPPREARMLRSQVYSGLWPAIVGTLLLVATAIAFAVPVGVAAGIYLAEYSGGTVKKVFSLFFDILASIPSIIVGLFGFSVAVFLHQNFSGRIYPCLLISALSLAFLVLPYVIRTTQVALESVPDPMRLTAPALGATRLQNIRHVLLPASLSSLFSGIILAMGRCAEDTAVIMMTGVVASAGIPRSFLESYEALPFYIYYISAQYTSQDELAGGFGAALILIIICMLLFSIAFVIKGRFEYRLTRI